MAMRTQFEIQNLKCDGCANTILKNLDKIVGIDQIHLEVDNALIAFHHTDDTKAAEVRSTLAKLGYPVVGDTNPMLKKAKSFVSCAIGKMQA